MLSFNRKKVTQSGDMENNGNEREKNNGGG